jgi:hypothetical protein
MVRCRQSSMRRRSKRIPGNSRESVATAGDTQLAPAEAKWPSVSRPTRRRAGRRRPTPARPAAPGRAGIPQRRPARSPWEGVSNMQVGVIGAPGSRSTMTLLARIGNGTVAGVCGLPASPRAATQRRQPESVRSPSIGCPTVAALHDVPGSARSSRSPGRKAVKVTLCRTRTS